MDEFRREVIITKWFFCARVGGGGGWGGVIWHNILVCFRVLLRGVEYNMVGWFVGWFVRTLFFLFSFVFFVFWAQEGWGAGDVSLSFLYVCRFKTVSKLH